MGVKVPFTDNQGLVERLLRDVYNWLVVLVAINIMWVLLSLTVILIPPATAGLFHVALQVTRGEGPTVTIFLVGMRRWFLHSYLWGLLLVAYVVVSLAALSFYSASTSLLAALLLVLAALVIGFVGAMQLYFWPYMMLQEKPGFLVAQRNAAFTLLGDPLAALVNVGVSVMLLALSLVLVIPFVILMPVVVAFWLTYTLIYWLKRRGLLPIES